MAIFNYSTFLDGGWAWVSPTVEGIFLMIAKLGEAGVKFFATKIEISTFSFLLGMFQIG